jgi:hypothetical protein
MEYQCITPCGGKIESPRLPIVVRLKNLAGKFHCGHVVKVNNY